MIMMMEQLVSWGVHKQTMMVLVHCLMIIEMTMKTLLQQIMIYKKTHRKEASGSLFHTIELQSLIMIIMLLTCSQHELFELCIWGGGYISFG